MDSTRTIDLFEEGSISEAHLTDFLSESHERHARKIIGLSHVAQVAYLTFFLAVSPLAAVSDPWFLERRRRDAVLTTSIYQEIIGRFISRAEALLISRQILEQAERERFVIAEFEAARGIQWGDEQ